MIQLFKAKSLKNNTKKNLKYSSKEKSKGRSMVEMLGVLAIIGVLSIGGISGYTLAMRRYQVNEIMNIANKSCNFYIIIASPRNNRKSI